ncbi:MAG: ABC transporter ATP-binding protein [Planctomycetota bacterium]|jgi:oligopeptide/dipeptide ABC transporter ATP-binding protein
MSALLTIRDLVIDYRTDRGVTRAVDGLDLDLHAGQALGLVGESGCGKSTAALGLLGLLPATAHISAGSATLADAGDLVRCQRRALDRIRGARLGVIFQDPMTSLTPHLRIGDQLSEPMRVHLGLDRQAARVRVRKLLQQVGINDGDSALRRYPHQFSGGQRQRIMIAGALACDPDVLIADEPTTALDVTVQAQILSLLNDLRRERGLSLLLVSHDLGVIATTCDTVAVMYAGRIVEHAPAATLFAQPRHPYTRNLLAAVPRLDGTRGAALATIPGLPPRLRGPWSGCAFADRCPQANDICRHSTPDLTTDEHAWRCPQETR